MALRLLWSVESRPKPEAATRRAGSEWLSHHEGGRLNSLRLLWPLDHPTWEQNTGHNRRVGPASEEPEPPRAHPVEQRLLWSVGSRPEPNVAPRELGVASCATTKAAVSTV